MKLEHVIVDDTVVVEISRTFPDRSWSDLIGRALVQLLDQARAAEEKADAAADARAARPTDDPVQLDHRLAAPVRRPS